LPNLPASNRRFYRIVLVELLFSAGGTFIFCWWNFYFLLVELLFSAGETFVSS